MHWYLSALRKYATFAGRARRREYWSFVLFSLVIVVALTIVDMAAGLWNYDARIGALSALYLVATLLPGLAVAVRRLHDTGRTGWWLLVGFVPVIGNIVLLVFFLLDSTPGDNQFGPNPKTSAAPL